MRKDFKDMSDRLQYWFGCFGRMKPTDKIEIALTGKDDVMLFTDICKEFIEQGNCDFEFSNDYKYFKRISPF